MPYCVIVAAFYILEANMLFWTSMFLSIYKYAR